MWTLDDNAISYKLLALSVMCKDDSRVYVSREESEEAEAARA
jgi:hypothetical protein